MSRDYVRRRSALQRTPKKAKQTSWRGLWLGLGVGLLVALGVVMRGPLLALVMPVKKAQARAVVKSQAQIGAPVIQALPAEPAPLQYSFYTVLPKDAPNEVATDKQQSNGFVSGYYLQVGSVKGQKAYARQEDRMAVLGFAASARHVQYHHEDWIQVLVGPYTTLSAAHDAKNMLLRVKIKSLLRVVRSPSAPSE